jgi:hypothetical protein
LHKITSIQDDFFMKLKHSYYSFRMQIISHDSGNNAFEN